MTKILGLIPVAELICMTIFVRRMNVSKHTQIEILKAEMKEGE